MSALAAKADRDDDKATGLELAGKWQLPPKRPGGTTLPSKLSNRTARGALDAKWSLIKGEPGLP
jgi:hypothetical protein